ncbi:sulfite oxidase [Micromonospora sp. NPDC049559]|uniref:sulfite oxidase n=1 Tax=Micromonospora sp. NPDC049559 TaxID=3155923 RepID=UPI00343BE5D8
MAGLAAAGVAIGAAELVAVATGPRSAPLVAVGGVVVDTVPEPLKRFAIDLFGVHDKTALLTGTAVLLAAFAALVGALAVRRLAVGLAGIGLFAAVGVAAALTRPAAGPAAALPALVGAALAAGLLWALTTGPLENPRRPETARGSGAGGVPAAGRDAEDQVARFAAEEYDQERRRFLTGAAVALAAAAVSGFAGRSLATRRGVAQARAAVTLPAPVSAAAPVPAGGEPTVPGLSAYLTPNPVFYRIDTALTVPQVDPDDWQLRIHGRVREPVTIDFAELLRRPMIERDITLTCVSNEVGGDLVGNARWLGTPLKRLLEEAGPLDGADQVVARSADGWTCGIPTAALLDGRDALLAIGMNGEPLPVEHGFPVRLVVPGLYGYVSACKWVVELELTAFADFDAYWVRRGWSARGPIKTQSRIDTPRTGRGLDAGTVTVAGVAWAQHRGVERVEVRVDGGDWQPARLAPASSVDTWVQWSWPWPATPGEHTLQVRATDRTGEVQTERPQDVLPDGATGYHTVRVTIR